MAGSLPSDRIELHLFLGWHDISARTNSFRRFEKREITKIEVDLTSSLAFWGPDAEKVNVCSRSVSGMDSWMKFIERPVSEIGASIKLSKVRITKFDAQTKINHCSGAMIGTPMGVIETRVSDIQASVKFNERSKTENERTLK